MSISIYLSEYAPKSFRKTIKPLLELLASIPTVVYGFFALIVVTPFLQQFIPGLSGFNSLSAGIVMGIMIIPFISSLSEDALHAVPKEMREASYGMGATKLQTAFKVLVGKFIQRYQAKKDARFVYIRFIGGALIKKYEIFIDFCEPSTLLSIIKIENANEGFVKETTTNQWA